MVIEVSKNKQIGILTINRPDSLNAMNREVLLEFSNELKKIQSDISSVEATGYTITNEPKKYGVPQKVYYQNFGKTLPLISRNHLWYYVVIRKT